MSKEVIFAGLLAVGCLVLVVVAFIAPHKPQPSDTVKTETTETVSPETDITGTTTTGGTTGTIAQNTTTGFTTAGSTAGASTGSTTAGFTSGGFTSATGGTTGSTTGFSTGGTTSTFTGGGTTTGFANGTTTSGFTTGGTTSTFTGGGSTGGFTTGGTTSGGYTGTAGGTTGGGTGGPTTLNATEKTHTVAAGETLGEISQKYYGSGKYWKKIVEGNPGLDPKAIKVGQKLVIPALSEAAPDTHAPTAGPGERTYTVKSGDSYYTIAKRELGQASRWKEIEKLNGIGPEELHVGQVIKLPAKKDASSTTGGTSTPDSHSTGTTGSGGKVHTVAAGETLSDISKQYFGTTARWKDIVKANPGVDPESLKVGQKLTIPEGATDSTSTSSSSSTSANPAADGADYLVKKGDTLPVIAERELGNKNDWKKILAVNPGLEPTKLRVGQKIKLPANGRTRTPASDDTRPSHPLAPAGGTTFGSGTSGAFPAPGGTTSGPGTFSGGGSTGTFTGGSSTGTYTGAGTTGSYTTGGSTGFSTSSGTAGSGTAGSTRRSDTLAPP